jgi:hypothetical protein
VVGSISTPVDPVELKMPANGAVIPPKASQGELVSSAASLWRASSGVMGVGLLPPSMYTSPDSPFAPGVPPKSHLAYAVVIEPPRE